MDKESEKLETLERWINELDARRSKLKESIKITQDELRILTDSRDAVWKKINELIKKAEIEKRKLAATPLVHEAQWRWEQVNKESEKNNQVPKKRLINVIVGEKVNLCPDCVFLLETYLLHELEENNHSELARAVIMRFGLDNGYQKTYEQIGYAHLSYTYKKYPLKLGVTHQSARNIVRHGLDLMGVYAYSMKKVLECICASHKRNDVLFADKWWEN